MHTVKCFYVLLFNTTNSIKHQAFVYTQLNYKQFYFKQFSLACYLFAHYLNVKKRKIVCVCVKEREREMRKRGTTKEKY